MKTIRVIECALLHESNTRCSPCREFRHTLNALKAAKWSKSEIKVCTNYHWLTKEQLLIQLKSARTIISHHEKVILQLKQKLEGDTTVVTIDSNTNEDLLNIMSHDYDSVTEKYPKDSFPVLFWQNQYDVAQQKSHTCFRWHPAMIKWCCFYNTNHPKHTSY